MVEQICEKCGARYSLYAPNCPSCGEASTAPEKVCGCPQPPAAPKPAPKPAKEEKPAEKPTEKPAAAEESTCECGGECECGGCPCEQLIIPAAIVAGVGLALLALCKLLRR